MHTGFVRVQVPLQLHPMMIAASTSMLFLRRLPPNEAWLLVFRDGVLTAVFKFIRDSVTVTVTEVEMT